MIIIMVKIIDLTSSVPTKKKYFLLKEILDSVA